MLETRIYNEGSWEKSSRETQTKARFEHACPCEGAVRKAAEADSNINQRMNEGIIRVKSCNLVISFLLETHVEQAGNELKKKTTDIYC